jgi:catechol 2,3-dioxygenase-like lactoylglutathione lyase family enzyme
MSHIIELDHIQLAMPEGGEAQARGFYQDLLGLAEVAKPAALALRGGCWFEHGAVKVHLGVEAAFTPAKKAHPAFIVGDLAQLADILERAGYKTTDGSPLKGYQRKDTFDPFGNRIELMERV